MGGLKAKTKLRLYIKIKEDLKAVELLKERKGMVRRLVELRAGSLNLAVEMGRRRGVRLEDRVCRWCKSGEVEDEEHFLLKCVKWEEEREVLWELIAKGPGGKRAREQWGVERILKEIGNRSDVRKGVWGLLKRREKEMGRERGRAGEVEEE